MSHASDLIEHFVDGSETPEEGDELARLVREDGSVSRALYERIMLEVDLYESYAGIAQIRAVPRRWKSWNPARMPLAVAVAVFFVIGLLALLFSVRPVAAPPAPKESSPAGPVLPSPKEKQAPPLEKIGPQPPESSEHEAAEKHGASSRKEEAEREYQKGLREVERKRAAGKIKEAEEKLREIERERDQKLREGGERRKHEDD